MASFNFVYTTFTTMTTDHCYCSSSLLMSLDFQHFHIHSWLADKILIVMISRPLRLLVWLLELSSLRRYWDLKIRCQWGFIPHCSAFWCFCLFVFSFVCLLLCLCFCLRVCIQMDGCFYAILNHQRLNNDLYESYTCINVSLEMKEMSFQLWKARTC